MAALLRSEELERSVTGSAASPAAAPEKIEAPDWSNLHLDILNNVAEQVATDVADYVHFRAVCKAWRSIHAAPRPGSQLPWLLLEWQYGERCLSFYSIAHSRNYKVPLPPALSDTASKTFSASCNGWLVLEDTESLTVSLLNPLTGVLIQLPASPDLISSRKREIILYDGGVKRKFSSMSPMVPAIAMSSGPASGEDCTVVIVSLCSWGLVSIRIGDDGWKLLDKATRYHDVIYRKGSFYAVDHSCGVAKFDSALNKVAVIPRPTFDPYCSLFWRFVQVSGELLIFCRLFNEVPVLDAYMHPPKYSTKTFGIFRLEREGEERSLVKVDSLGDSILFYGFSNGLSCPAAEYPGRKPNTIHTAEAYITRDFDRTVLSYVEPGVYDVASATVEPLPDGTQIRRPSACFSAWFTPTLSS